MRVPRRAGRVSEHGVTLIEMLVTIALISVGVLGLAGGVANLQVSARVTTDQTRLELAMRQVTDYLRAPYNGDATTSIQYAPCAATYAIPATIAGVTLLAPAGPLRVLPTVTVAVSTSATRSSGAAPFPVKDCTSGVFAPQIGCTAANCDWGVQKVTVTITSTTNRSLTRLVYKGLST
jgi:prepilin-type N-terminal cleavage/methylation domain-containing protein